MVGAALDFQLVEHLATAALDIGGLPDATGVQRGETGQGGDAIDADGDQALAPLVEEALQGLDHLRTGPALGDGEQLAAVALVQGGHDRTGVELVQHAGLVDDVLGRLVGFPGADMHRRQRGDVQGMAVVGAHAIALPGRRMPTTGA